MKFQWLPIIALSFMTFTQAHGQIFNVQMTSGGNGLNGDTWTSSVSPLAYTGTTWSESYGGNLSDIPDSNNGSSTVSYTLASTGLGVSNNGAPAALPVFGSTVFGYQADLTLTISGLQSNHYYELFLVSAYDGGYGGTFTITGFPPKTSAGNSGLAYFSNGKNYVMFNNIAAINNQIVVTDSAPGSFAMLNAFQLKVLPAPEPSTYALIGLGLLSLAVVGRLRKFKA
jgi:hypothetical protein